MVELLPLEPELSTTADGVSQWTGRWSRMLLPEELDAERRRGIDWAVRALDAARGRIISGQQIGFDTWTAAVEAVWWALALDDVLNDLIGPGYRIARAADEDGRVAHGLRWLRHRHAHEIVVTGAGGPKRDFFNGGFGPPFYISPSNRWKLSREIPAEHDTSASLRPQYDETVAGRSLEEPLTQAASWFRHVRSSLGIDSPSHQEDPSIL